MLGTAGREQANLEASRRLIDTGRRLHLSHATFLLPSGSDEPKPKP